MRCEVGSRKRIEGLWCEGCERVLAFMVMSRERVESVEIGIEKIPTPTHA